MSDLLSPLTLSRGPSLNNRFMLAPLTNTQSFEDGRLSDEEYRWLTMRAQGGFGLTMTCASHVQAIGKGFPGQLGIFSDDHLEGLKRLSSKIKTSGSVAICQIHHAGMRHLRNLLDKNLYAPLIIKSLMLEDFLVVKLRASEMTLLGPLYDQSKQALMA